MRHDRCTYTDRKALRVLLLRNHSRNFPNLACARREPLSDILGLSRYLEIVALQARQVIRLLQLVRCHSLSKLLKAIVILWNSHTYTNGAFQRFGLVNQMMIASRATRLIPNAMPLQSCRMRFRASACTIFHSTLDAIG
jgi:hypothetical protein